jgi:SAM-dependent methyltransferase
VCDDPLGSTPWSDPGTIAGFRSTPPNATLLDVARAELASPGDGWLLDIGCGVGRNAISLSQEGWRVVGVDLSLAALRAADSFPRALARMEHLPVRDASFDFIVAHGIWNLARSAAEFRGGVREAARAARRGAPLFVFTFSRTTLPANAQPVTGEPYVFTQFSGQPQCFLTDTQLVRELADAGFHADSELPLHELNRPQPGALAVGRAPVILEGLFRRK